MGLRDAGRKSRAMISPRQAEGAKHDGVESAGLAVRRAGPFLHVQHGFAERLARPRRFLFTAQAAYTGPRRADPRKGSILGRTGRVCSSRGLAGVVDWSCG